VLCSRHELSTWSFNGEVDKFLNFLDAMPLVAVESAIRITSLSHALANVSLAVQRNSTWDSLIPRASLRLQGQMSY
jgi:hypothetical protein